MKVNNGYSSISVELVNAPQLVGWEARVFDMAKMTWGSYDGVQYDPDNSVHEELVWGAFEGRVLPTVLEQLQLQFVIKGITRTCSHQLVRGRVGWGYNQQSQMAEVLLRDMSIPMHVHAIPELRERIELFARMASQLYNDIIDAGLPPQSARYVLPEGTHTDVYAVCTFPALRGFVGNRTCLSTNDEINLVARMMRQAVLAAEPRWAKYLLQSCDRTGKCNLTDPVFPCCGKFPQAVPTTGHWGNADNNIHMELKRRPDLHVHETDAKVVDAMDRWHRKAGRFDVSSLDGQV